MVFHALDSIPVEENYTVSALIERANKNAGKEVLQLLKEHQQWCQDVTLLIKHT